MSSIFDQYVSVGEQTAYGTSVNPTRSYDARSDDWQVESQPVSVEGYRRDAQAIPQDQYRTIIKGASGSIEVPWFTRGMGLLLKHLLGAHTAPVPVWTDTDRTVSGTINTGAAALNLNAAPSGLTIAVGDKLRMGSEIVRVTAVTTTTNYTIARAQDGTTAATHSSGTQVDIVRSWTSVFQTDDTGPSGSYTIQVGRVDIGGTDRPMNYEGCVPTGFSVEAALDAGLMLNVSFDSRRENHAATAVAPVYISDAEPFMWEDIKVSIGGTELDTASGFSLEGDLGMRTDRYYLKGAASKEQPKRNARPSYTGTIEMDYDSKAHAAYLDFKAGTLRAIKLEATYPDAIEGIAGKPKVTIEIAAARFTGDTPTSNVEDSSTISLPFMAFWDGTNPALKVTIVSTDSAL